METLLTSRRAPLWAGLILVLAALGAYHNSLTGPFVFDDRPAIAENPTIRHLGSAWSPPPGALPVSGRPVMNLSLALNYAISGIHPWSYHALNLAIHILAGLTLFGIVRRTLEKPGSGDSARPYALTVAFAAALLWTVHPLQTESVTYISQRAESLMGLFYLLTLYCFIRGARLGPQRGYDAAVSGEGQKPEEEKPAGHASFLWFGLSCLACACGMLTKEVMVSAPLMALLYDRTFLSGSFREAWVRRRKAYAALAGTWFLLVLSVALGGLTRGDTSGFAIEASWWSYWLTQFEAVVRYLRLSIWPRPLVVYYEAFWATDLGPVLPYALIVIPLLAATVWALRHRPVAAFFGVWFFAILAPTSLVPNSIQMIAEHRMYLPLAAVVVAAVVGIFSVLSRTAALAACLAVALGLGAATVRRNEVYQSSLSLWADTVAKRPNNPFAHNNLGNSLRERGSLEEALVQYRLALEPAADSVYAYVNLGNTLGQLGRLPEAIAALEQAHQLRPNWPSIHNDLADALSHAGRLKEAAAHYQEALRIRPDFPQAENGLGTVLMRAGDAQGALPHFEAALRMNPDYAEAHNNFGAALATLNRLPEAVPQFERAIELKPDYSEARLSLGNAYYQANRLDDAIHEYEEALRSAAGSAETHDHYGILLAEAGRFADSEDQFKQALKLKPGDPEIQGNLQQVQAAERSKSGGP
jgi:tetratricopeptide (TPR) repeat protein